MKKMILCHFGEFLVFTQSDFENTPLKLINESTLVTHLSLICAWNSLISARQKCKQKKFKGDVYSSQSVGVSLFCEPLSFSAIFPLYQKLSNCWASKVSVKYRFSFNNTSAQLSKSSAGVFFITCFLQIVVYTNFKQMKTSNILHTLSFHSSNSTDNRCTDSQSYPSEFTGSDIQHFI